MKEQNEHTEHTENLIVLGEDSGYFGVAGCAAGTQIIYSYILRPYFK